MFTVTIPEWNIESTDVYKRQELLVTQNSIKQLTSLATPKSNGIGDAPQGVAPPTPPGMRVRTGRFEKLRSPRGMATHRC